MKQQYTFSNFFSFLPFLLAAFLWLGGSSVMAGGTAYEPVPGSITLSGGTTTCQNVSVTLSGSVDGNKCDNNDGGQTTGTIQWYSSTDNSSATPGDDILLQTDPYTTNDANTVSYSYDPDVTATGTTYYYYVLTWGDSGGDPPCIGAGSATSGVVEVIVETPGVSCHNYCTTSYSNNTDDWISNVTFNTINNSSSGDGGYIDNTSMCTFVSPGETIQLCVDVTVNGPYTQYVSAFFDWDNDGVIGAGESYDLGTTDGTAGTHTICQDILIPLTAPAGESLLMRIAELYNAYPTACTNSTFGEAEDYCLTITSCTTTVPVAACSDCGVPAGDVYTLASCDTDATLSGNSITQGTGTWQLISGSGSISPPGSATPTVTGLGAGDNIFAYVVDDSPCPTLGDTITITTVDTPTPADAGDDIEACDVAGTATFDATGNTPDTGAGESGSWSCTAGCGNVSPTTSANQSESFAVTGGVGTTVTMTWTITNGTCSHSDDVVFTVINDALTANAGSDIPDACDLQTETLAATAPALGAGTWSTTSSANVLDPNDPTSDVSLLLQSESPVTLTWTVSANGCTSATDDIIITVGNCNPNVTTLASCGSPSGTLETFYDSGGAGGNYSANEHLVQTYCPANPGTEWVTVSFNSLDISGSTDYMVVIDGDGTGDPIIEQLDGASSAPTYTSSSDDGCLTFVFLSNSSTFTLASGWEAEVSCTDVGAGTNNHICQESDCQGGCARTICGTGDYSWTPSDNNIEELNDGNEDCLGRSEDCSVWYYINPEGPGWLSLDITTNSGQDQDFAVWQGYNSELECPVVSQDAPILCNFAGMNAAGTGFNTTQGAASYEDNIVATQTDIDNGVYYMLLVNTYIPGGSCSQVEATFSFDGTMLLSCEPLGSMLSVFKGINLGERNYIWWETIQEYNLRSFTLQASKNGYDWSSVGTVAATGNSNEGVYYGLNDETPSFPVTYYRLMQEDFDGKVTYSQVISVSTLLDEDSWITDVFPNPAENSFTFQYNGHNTKDLLKVAIYDMTGRLVHAQEFTPYKNEALLVLTDNLENGMYKISFTQGDKTHLQNLSILR